MGFIQMKVNHYDIPADRLRELAAQGLGDRALGVIFGCSAQVIAARRGKHGIPAAVPLHRRIEVDVTRIAELASMKWTDRRIAAELGAAFDEARRDGRMTEETIQTAIAEHRTKHPYR